MYIWLSSSYFGTLSVSLTAASSPKGRAKGAGCASALNHNLPRKACARNINISRCFANDTQGGNGRKLVYSSEILKILEIFLKMLCN